MIKENPCPLCLYKSFISMGLFLITIFLSYSRANAQPIRINGDLEGVAGDSVIFYLHPYFSYVWQNSNATEYDSPVEKNIFGFQSKLQCSHSYLSAYLKSKNNYRLLFKLFLVVPGDSTHVVVKKDTLLFTGRGDEKFVCQFKIQKVPEINFTKKELLSFKNYTTSFAFNMYNKKKSDSLLKLKLDVVEEFKPALQKDVYKQISLNLVAENLFNQYKSLSLDFRYHSSEALSARNDKIKFFKRLEKYALPKDFDDTLFAESSSASDYLLFKAIREVQFENYLLKKPLPLSYDALNLARRAARPHGQSLKEKLFALSFYLFYRPENEKDFRKLDMALSETKSFYFYNYLIELKKAMNPGLEAFDFTLYDTDDNKITLKNFKGKVVVLDFWFTGCTYCVWLEKRMKKIRDFFKQDTSVVFIGVNLDTKKSTFLNGLASRIYTGENEVDLYTGGSAFENPLVKHYQITGCPELVIIDKRQRTFVSKPARPVDETTDREFINLILNAENLRN